MQTDNSKWPCLPCVWCVIFEKSGQTCALKAFQIQQRKG
jgi:hypothetical protein